MSDVPQEETLCAIFQRTAAKHSDHPALRTKDGELELAWGEYARRVERIAAGLHAIGVRRGDAVGLMLVNRPEFHLCDTAAVHLGAAGFSLYNTSSAEQLQYVIADSGARLLFSERQFLERLREAIELGGTAVETIVLVDGDAEGAVPLADLEAADPEGFDFEAAWRTVEPGDVLTLIYTSGTTGPPKGVELTHANMVAELRGLHAVWPQPERGRSVSFLPAAHVADRALSHYGPMVYGSTITSCPDATQLFTYLPEVRPTLMGGVPRIWEKLKAALEAGFAAEQDPSRRLAVEQALEAGIRAVRLEQAGEELTPELAEARARAERELCAPLRERLGLDEVQVWVVGAAATPIDVMEFFFALGCPLAEVWGMSELSCVATWNPPDRVRIGTVGPPIPGCELRIAEDGEVLVRGPLVMKGYRNRPEQTAETIDEQGWLHSGDVGELDEHGYLRIVDRKKELIINAAGKNMSPANIEGHIKGSSPLIGQAVCIGDGRPYNVALIVLDPDVAPVFASRNGIENGSLAALAAHEAVRNEVAAGVERANAKLSRVEQIKRFTILPLDWQPAGDELTPTMKLKRKPIAQKYAEEIEALYIA